MAGGSDVGGVELACFFKRFDFFFRIANTIVAEAKQVPGFGKGWLPSDGLFQLRDGSGRVAAFIERQGGANEAVGDGVNASPPRRQGFRIPGLDLDRLGREEHFRAGGGQVEGEKKAAASDVFAADGVKFQLRALVGPSGNSFRADETGAGGFNHPRFIGEATDLGADLFAFGVEAEDGEG